MGYISNQIKSTVVSQLKDLNTTEIVNNAKNVSKEIGVNVNINDKMKELGAPVKAFTDSIKFGDTTLSQLKPPAGVRDYMPKAISSALGNAKIPTEINGVKLPQLPDLSSATDGFTKALDSVGLGSISDKLGIRDVSDILGNTNFNDLYSVPLPEIQTSEIPDVESAFKDINFDGINADISSLSEKIPGLEDLDKLF